MFTLALDRLSRHPSVVKSLTGLSWEKFQNLVEPFSRALADLRLLRPGRLRAPGAGNKGVLDTAPKKLFFTLFYLKVYPTFRVAAFLFNKPFGKMAAELRLLRKALEVALGHAMALPRRRLTCVDQVLANFPDSRHLILDATERPIRRPARPKPQRNHYRGKKKRHTRKHLVLCDEHRRIAALSPAKPGRRHDQRLLDKSG